ncbi:MAG: hypothetical protein HYX71_05550 [Opitutae bacterium]|nr:hypothetical protein [Opitutae bacterium]
MRLPKEILVLLALLLLMLAGVSWYVVDRRAKNRLPADAKPSAGQPLTPAKP